MNMDSLEFNKLNVGDTILFQGKEYWVQMVNRFNQKIAIYLNNDDDWFGRVTWLEKEDCSIVESTSS